MVKSITWDAKQKTGCSYISLFFPTETGGHEGHADKAGGQRLRNQTESGLQSSPGPLPAGGVSLEGSAARHSGGDKGRDKALLR